MINNTATKNDAGFYLTSSSNNTLTANIATNNRDGFSLWYSSSNNTLTNNTAINIAITGIGHGFGLDSSCNDNILTNNIATNNRDGFSLMSSCSSNFLINNKATQNSYNGFSLSSSSNNTFTNNDATQSIYNGFSLSSSSNNNVFTNNTALNNRDGFSLSSSSSNVLTNNIVKTNAIYGITIKTGSKTNTIHWNKFIYNNYQTGSSQGYDDGMNNIFAQNYWNDYTTPDQDNDGIVDIPYQLDGSAVNRDFTPVTSVIPTTPDIESPTDIGYLEHSTGHTITWIITDDNPTTYTIKCNGTLIVSGSWSSAVNITINVDGLSPAIYEYTITATDADGLTASDSVLVKVTSTIPTVPDIDSPTDIMYLEHSTGHTITWIITDDNPTTYTIICNGTLIVSGSWSSAVNITINVDGLSPAIYEYTINVTDADGLTASDIVSVNVTKLDLISSDSQQTSWFSPLLFLLTIGVYIYLKRFKTNSN